MKSFRTVKGNWFLPDKPDLKIPGILSFNAEYGLVLELFGTFDNVSSDFNLMMERDYKQFDLINGVTFDLKKITLYKTRETNFHLSKEGGNVQISIKYCFFGYNFQKKEELIFNNISAEFPNLDIWLGIYGFDRLEHNFKIHETILKYKLPENINFEINENKSGKFLFSRNIPLSKNTSEIRINQSNRFIIKYKKAESFESLIKDLKIFQDFLTFSFSKKVEPLRIDLLTIYEDQYGQKIDVEMVYANNQLNDRDTHKSTFDYLFTYQDITKKFESVIKKWYLLNSVLNPVIGLVIETFYNRNSILDYRFLSLAQAFESFHRKYRNNLGRNTKDFKQMLGEIKIGVPKEHRDYVFQRISRNEPDLKTRIEQLCKELPFEISSKIIGDFNLFNKQFRDTRNYLSHYDAHDDSLVLKGQDLYDFSEKLRLMLIYFILKESGLEEGLLISIFKRSEKYFFYNAFINK